MKKLTTASLMMNPTGTACGSVGNTSLSHEEVIDFINKFFGGEIFVNDNWDEVVKGFNAGTDDIYGICEINAKIHRHISKKDRMELYEDNNLRDTIEEYEEDFETLSKDDLVGFVFQYLVSEVGDGSARYEDGCLDENGMIYFEVE